MNIIEVKVTTVNEDGSVTEYVAGFEASSDSEAIISWDPFQ